MAAVAAADNPDMRRIAAGGDHSLAIKPDGSLWAWGNNADGELGDRTTTNRPRPVQVLTEVAAVAAGDWHTLAIKTDGSLWAWGWNRHGQIGDGTATSRMSPIQVSGFGPTVSSPDFVVTGVALIPSSPIANGTFSAAVTVKNQGTLAGTPGTLQVWANQVGAPACSAVGNKTATLPSLAAGASQTVAFGGLAAGAAGVAGIKILRAFIDSQCKTAESNETNNQYTSVYTVVPPTSNFVITSVVPTPSGPLANGTFSAAITVTNQGTLAGTPGALQVWANQAAMPVCRALGNNSATLTSLAGGASRTVTLSSLPAGTAGTKTLRAFVDSQCLSAESNEADNQSTAPYTVYARPIPDFVVTNVVLTPPRPTANGTFSAAVTIKNQGSGSGEAGYLDVWANQATTQSCPADGNSYVSVGTLAAGASKTVTVAGLPAGAAGAKTLRAFVDSYCGTGESYDGNNQTVKAYSVVP